MTEMFKLRSILMSFVLAGSVAFAAVADEAKPHEANQTDQDMSIGEASDNMVKDAEKVGEKAKEIGSDVADGAEDAYDSTEKAMREATE
jgi:hypothetical protein